jgi:uncharacterized protein (DUF1697 family)
MALVVFLRGVNVGGHRTFRPTQLAVALAHLRAINIGAAGTLIIQREMSPVSARAAVERALPFATELAICDTRDILKLVSKDPFRSEPAGSDVVRFVSVLSTRARCTPNLPMQFPETGKWLVKILARRGRCVFGVYRRQIKAVGYLGSFDRLFGVPVTTRNWNTILKIAAAVKR